TGPLAAALAADEPDAVPGAAVAELAAWRPTVLIVEDLHWADDATLDVLAHVARRLADLPALLVLTYRDEVPPTHPLRRVLGALTAVPVHRLALRPLSPAAVDGLAAGSGRDPVTLHTLTGGNPFYVTEALAAPGMAVPATVADAVLARVGRLDPACRAAVEQLSVVPTAVEFGLARQLLGDRFDVLAPAEEQGVLQVRADGLAFRHELARRAVELGMPVLHRRTLHARVVEALGAAEPQDLPRLVHHAVQAGDVDAVLAYAPVAGRQAAAAGSHRQALALLEVALRHAGRLPEGERAYLHDDHAWELHNAHRHEEAVAESERAVVLFTAVGEPRALGAAQVRLSRHRYMTGDTDGAEEAAAAALRTVTPLRSPDALASAAANRGALLALGGHPAARDAMREAHALAERAGRFDLVALCLNYESIAETDVDVDRRIDLLRASVELAARHGDDEAVARGYTNLAEMLYRYTRFPELAEVLAEGLAFTDEHTLPSHAYNLEVHRLLLALRLGDWTTAEAGLEALVDQADDPGMLAGHSRPPYGRLLARRGVPGAGQLLALAWERAVRQRSLLCLAYAGTALVEYAWLADRPDLAETVLEGWAPHAARPSAEPVHAELLRYAARAGAAVTAFPGCPEPWAAGLRGDWRAAARGWERLGDPYEQALELAASGEPEPTLAALRTLDDLGADAAVRQVRRRLRELGVTRIPRRPTAGTRAHPAGLTRRQADVLTLLADGLTNAEIADRLVLSVRTVDTHVGAILDRLGVRTRREAAAVARTLDEEPL
ncbi:MAG: hypothetical protein QOK35_3058, partial [Pseudonocardiales bacterium]|nr:hypothetical protein [Pseudonocardiales bacterium]